MKVLIVDDSRRVRRLVRGFLPKSVCETYECGDGVEAVRLYEEKRPDWVLMDWEMPKVDGITATREIIARFPAAHICMVTAHDSGDLKDKAIEAGACDFVVKDDLRKLASILVS